MCDDCLFSQLSPRARRLKGKEKGLLGARETRGAREEGGKCLPGYKCGRLLKEESRNHTWLVI